LRQRNFSFLRVLDELAPKISRFQQQMATSVEGVDSKVDKLTNQLASF
jgi:hypothetical protein